jgi:hypothetical protein
MKDMQAATIELEVRLDALIELLEEAEERYWVLFLRRARERIRGNQLTGVTQVISCYQGTGTLSDLQPTSKRGTPEHLFAARWLKLRDSVFRSADQLLSSVARARNASEQPPER